MPMTTEPDDAGPWWQRIGWFIGLWVASVAVIGTVAYLLRWWLHP